MLKIPEITDSHNRDRHGIFLTWSLNAPVSKWLKKKTKQEIIQEFWLRVTLKRNILADSCSTNIFHSLQNKRKRRNTACFSHDIRKSKFRTFHRQTNVSLHRRGNLCITLHLQRTTVWRLNIALVHQYFDLFILCNLRFVCSKYNKYCRQSKPEGNLTCYGSARLDDSMLSSSKRKGLVAFNYNACRRMDYVCVCVCVCVTRA
jgi:hypothetical protein